MTAVELLVELASLQTAFLTLDAAIKTTNRRVNALEHVVKPKLENTIAYIKVWVAVAPGRLWDLIIHAADAACMNAVSGSHESMWPRCGDVISGRVG